MAYDALLAEVGDYPKAGGIFRRAVGYALALDLADLQARYGVKIGDTRLGDGVPAGDEETSDTFTEADFWASRPMLAHIHRSAKAQLMPPWGVLGGVLAQIVAATGPNVRLPAILGGEGSLNLFLAFVGASGDGKGGSMAVARHAVEIPWDTRADKIMPGSGEGLVGVYAVAKKERGEPWRTVRIRDRALIDCPEVDTMKALGGDRAGSVLFPFLRMAWSGEGIGRANATPERNVSIDDHSYRCVLLVGVQPEAAEILISDTKGTAQRFVWLPIDDPDPLRTEAPGPIPWNLPGGGGPIHDFYSTNLKLITVCEIAREAIIDNRIKRLRREGDALDGHAMMSRLKVAAALGLLESRFEVTEEDWQLAGYVMAKSDATRQETIETLTARAAAGHALRGKHQAISKLSAEETETELRDAKVAQVSQTLLAKLTDEWTAKSDLRRSLKATLRIYFDDAITALIATGAAERQDTPKGYEVRKTP
jgi:hypothetical protein